MELSAGLPRVSEIYQKTWFFEVRVVIWTQHCRFQPIASFELQLQSEGGKWATFSPSFSLPPPSLPRPAPNQVNEECHSSSSLWLRLTDWLKASENTRATDFCQRRREQLAYSQVQKWFVYLHYFCKNFATLKAHLFFISCSIILLTLSFGHECRIVHKCQIGCVRSLLA